MAFLLDEAGVSERRGSSCWWEIILDLFKPSHLV